MTLLPTITWGGQEFYDISGIVQPNRDTRPGTDGIAVHNTVGQTEFPDTNANGTALDEQIEHVKAIDRYHIAQGYGGFGYNAISFRDGTVMTVGKAEGVRAHVAYENYHLAGIAMAGDFSTEPVPIGCILGVARFLLAMQKDYGVNTVKGHREWVQPAHLPQWATACPGDSGVSYIGQMVMAREALNGPSPEELAREVRRRMTEAILPNVLNANLEGLAAQVKYLSGGQWC